MLSIDIAKFGALMLLLFATSCAHKPQTTKDNEFSACPDIKGLPVLSDSQCQYIAAPLEYNADNSEMVSLFVRKFPALDNRRGSIVMLAGGPGESGASYYADIDFFRKVFEDFDVIVPDHRGTGYSTRLCEPEETKGSDGGFDLVNQEWSSCIGKLYAATDRTRAFNLNNAAQDVATIIDALGPQDDVYIYGVSYGTALAIAAAKRTDVSLSGIILDSLTPLPGDNQNDLGHRSQITDRIGQALLERCSTDPGCPLKGNAKAIYANLLKRVDAGETVAGLKEIPNGDLRQFMGLILDAPIARNQIPAIIAAMASNDESAGELIRNVTKSYEDFLSSILSFEQAKASIPLTSVMSGSEFNARKDLTAEQVAAEKSRLGFTSPVPGYLVSGGFPTYKPAAVPNMRTDLPPMFVLHGTLDPKTSYDAAMRHVKTLEKTTSVALLTLTDSPHVAFFTSKDCLEKPLKDFVRKIPSGNMECAAKDAAIQW